MPASLGKDSLLPPNPAPPELRPARAPLPQEGAFPPPRTPLPGRSLAGSQFYF